MRKRILSMLCVFALCFTLLPVSALADVSDWETTPPTTTGGWTETGNYNTSWFDGENAPEGTEDDPYIISDAADLAGLSFLVNGLGPNKIAYSFEGKYIEIDKNATDIDLAAYEWTPIGNKNGVYDSEAKPGTGTTTAWFKGHFDGNNVPIKNLRITDADNDVVGLFGYALEAVIENVKLENAYISAVNVIDGTYVGGIVALSDGSTVQGCTVVSGLITAKNDRSGTNGYVGGIIGTNGKSLYNSTFQSGNASHVTDCTNGAKIISATQYTGGIVGINGTANTAQTKVYCTVTGCTNQGQIEVSSGSEKFYAGGIAGCNLTTIANCENKAAVKNTTGHAAGIAGYFEGRKAYIADDANVLIQNCKNTGAVSGYSYVGGIVAYSYSETNAAIANCTNSGAIASLSGSDGNPEMGGIAGRVGSSKGKFTISNCVNTGSVSGETSETTPSSSGTNTVGGLVGTLRKSFEVSNCYNTGTVTNYAATSATLLVSTAGGLAGSVGTDGEVHDCYNVGEVKGYRVGGLIGISTASGGSTPQLTDCYNIGTLTGTIVGGVLGSVMSGCQAPTITDCTYWNGCLSGSGNGNGYGTSKSSNQMTGDSWSSEMGLDTKTWVKSQNTGTTGYLPVLTNNKQDPAPTLTRTGLASRTLVITNIPTDGGTERNSFLLSERSFDLNATVDPAVGTVSWTTSNAQVATVDQNGAVALVGPGDVSITASVAKDAIYEKASDSYAFTVTDTITEIIINGLGELSLGSAIPTTASTPNDAKYNIVPYISIGGTPPDIHWTYEDGSEITGTTFAAGHKYKGTIKVQPINTYYSFASDVKVTLSGVGTSVSYDHEADTSNPEAILITISMDYSKTQAKITGVQAAGELVYNGLPQTGYTGEPSSAYSGDYEIIYEGKGADGTTYGPALTAPTNAGEYTVLIAIPDSDTTYFGSVKLNFSIGKAAATVKALERNIYVGEEIPDLTNPVKGTDYAVDGLIGNDTLGGSISMKYQKDGTDVTPSNATAGEYDIVVSGVIENGNYEVTYSNSKLTISNRSGGGGGGVTTYQVDVEDTANGEVKSSHSRASRGTTVTLTVTPNEGYELASLTITKSNSEEVKFTDKGNGKFTFTMPGSKVTVEAVFKAIVPNYSDCDRGLNCPLWDFTDLNVNAWYHDGVHFCIDEGLMEGYGGGLFGPNDTLSRAQLCQIVYNMEGQPATSGSSVFTDVADGAWYADAVTWAASQGIVGGYGNGLFGPEDNITREQLASILYRYAQSKGYDTSVGENTNILSYTDALEISEYAIPAMQWACGAGVIEGVTDSTLVPQGDATRAQAAVMLMRFCEEYVVW